MTHKSKDKVAVPPLWSPLAWRCEDKSGAMVEMLEVNTKPRGFAAEFAKRGNPLTLNADGEVIAEDEAALAEWRGIMTNIDLALEDNRLAVGFVIVERARAMVRNLFLDLTVHGK